MLSGGPPRPAGLLADLVHVRDRPLDEHHGAARGFGHHAPPEARSAAVRRAIRSQMLRTQAACRRRPGQRKPRRTRGLGDATRDTAWVRNSTAPVSVHFHNSKLRSPASSRAATLDARPGRIDDPSFNDLLQPIARGLIAADDVTEIGELVAGSKPGRTSSEQITLYKSVGVASQDGAAAALVLRTARAREAGREIALE